MKTFLFTVLFLVLFLLITSFAWSASLVCDPQAGVVSYSVEVDGVVVAPAYPAESDGSILYNIDGLPQGQHTFRLSAMGQGGWSSDWSSPLDATKPGSPGSVRIVNP